MKKNDLKDVATKPPADAKPSKGQESRASILLTAARLATVKGLDGLSIGDLAAEVGMSKSGLYAHFKSKEELELATIDAALEIFDREVIQPAIGAPAGVKRLMALAHSFLGHLERQVFPGGCFFAAVAMELDTRPGPARDKVAGIQALWLSMLTECFVAGQSSGELDPMADAAQAVFEIEGMLLVANFLFVMNRDVAVLAQARKGVENVLARIELQRKAKGGRK